jgi:hypothetical protein
MKQMLMNNGTRDAGRFMNFVVDCPFSIFNYFLTYY